MRITAGRSAAGVERAGTSLRVKPPSFPTIEAAWNLAVWSAMLRRAAPACDAAGSAFDIRALGHRPSLARRRGKYRLWRWHPSGSRRGTAIVFAIARAIPATDEDAGDQFSRKALRGETTRSFAEGGHVRWSACAGSDSPYDRTIGGPDLRGGSLGRLQGERTTQQRVEPFERDPDDIGRVGDARWVSNGP